MAWEKFGHLSIFLIKTSYSGQESQQDLLAKDKSRM